MQIQVNTDKHIDGSEAVAAHVEAVLQRTLRHLRDHVTRVEVHLSDENAGKGGIDDMRCLLEARLQRLQPVAVAHQAGSLHQAIDGAADKLRAALEATLGRIADTRRRRTDDDDKADGD
ncbi:MAG: HPF/RaiA family ribosome-associated protein [Burkholderiaceae bacterium]|nr:HPF/RaiA family ribosome-associated protein [Burkholderiaceae bacterium]